VKQSTTILSRAVLAGCAVLGLAGAPAAASGSVSYLTTVDIDVLPFADLAIIGSNLLYLEIPPPGSTVPASGVRFVVAGNASATLVAEPDDFIFVRGEGNLGRAVLNGESIGYKLELRFPSGGVGTSYPQYAALPLSVEGPTVPPLTVDLMATGGSREGVLHMESDPNWTPTGGIPLPGIYVGQVVLTLIADF
jgi:hypothetical protein